MQKIALSVIDDQKIFRQMLSIYFNSIPELELIGSFTNGIQFLKFLESAPERVPEVIIMDIDMPVMGGMELTNQLQQHYPQIKIIVLSVHDEIDIVSQMIHAGASGYLDKNCDCRELETAVLSIAKTGFYMNPQMIQSLKPSKSIRNTIEKDEILLSRRELEVLALICKEYTNTEIAEILFISVRTVDGHRNNLLNKTKSRNTAGLVLHAVRNKLVSP